MHLKVQALAALWDAEKRHLGKLQQKNPFGKYEEYAIVFLLTGYTFEMQVRDQTPDMRYNGKEGGKRGKGGRLM